ncbi:MAG: tetratricopeptide repeat protein [Chitinophagaceae bacterium]
MKMYAPVISFLLVAVCFNAGAQQVDEIIQQGNDFYKQNQFDKAEAAYKEAADADKGQNSTADFNRANAMIRQNKTAEAAKVLDQVIMNAPKADLQSKAYYNQGVLLSGQKKLEESIEAYKNALRRNPDDKEARENLQKALLELKKKTPPPPPPPKKENKKNQQKQKEQPQMNQKEAEQRLKLLDEKEKEIQQRMQNAKTGAAQQKDW